MSGFRGVQRRRTVVRSAQMQEGRDIRASRAANEAIISFLCVRFSKLRQWPGGPANVPATSSAALSGQRRWYTQSQRAMHERYRRCPDCDEGAFTGNGRCSRCHGTGINCNLGSDVPACPGCAGTGICSTCGGAGVYPPPPEEKIIRKLFE